jgi:transposase-like protein
LRRKEESLRMARARKYPEELLERATRLVFESGRPIAHVGRDLGIAPETLANTCVESKVMRAGARIR